MKRSTGLLIFLVGAGWMAILFYSFVTGMSKTFKQKPQRSKQASAGEQLRQNREQADANRRDQQQQAEYQRQRMRDLELQMRDVRSKY